MLSRLSLPSERIKQLLRFVYTRRNCATKLVCWARLCAN
ncbi:Uncharacterised protein [Vibrio cholerae]|nr:Uncharacterised protein [Vibrio cholerae]